MILTIVGILIILWLLGFIGNIGGDVIHALLIIALIVFVYDLLVSRRA